MLLNKLTWLAWNYGGWVQLFQLNNLNYTVYKLTDNVLLRLRNIGIEIILLAKSNLGPNDNEYDSM